MIKFDQKHDFDQIWSNFIFLIFFNFCWFFLFLDSQYFVFFWNWVFLKKQKLVQKLNFVFFIIVHSPYFTFFLQVLVLLKSSVSFNFNREFHYFHLFLYNFSFCWKTILLNCKFPILKKTNPKPAQCLPFHWNAKKLIKMFAKLFQKYVNI